MFVGSERSSRTLLLDALIECFAELKEKHLPVRQSDRLFPKRGTKRNYPRYETGIELGRVKVWSFEEKQSRG